MGNSTARDRSRIQAEPESEGGATIEALPANDVGIACLVCNFVMLSFRRPTASISGSYKQIINTMTTIN